MRADAQAKREAIIAAAQELVAERGAEVPFNQIAARAGVGIATLYRHFPTRDDLLLGIGSDFLGRMAAVFDAHAATWDTDPSSAWSAIARDLAALRMGAVFPALVQGRSLDDLPPAALRLRAEGIGQVRDILARAQANGLVREDISVEHFQIGLGVLTRPLPELVQSELPDMHDWLIEVYLRGLRP
ncbi:MAG: TetR/AcrR family transcriptional regulator [Micrococcales bacterium]|nr:TetR/AcrR family transcriptional regulator [Micrococcales bacterium]